jgi:hypothetical protein
MILMIGNNNAAEELQELCRALCHVNGRTSSLAVHDTCKIDSADCNLQTCHVDAVKNHKERYSDLACEDPITSLGSQPLTTNRTAQSW